eukprot:6202391-Pleurochrysis_carterae.AAC.1
MIRQEGKPTALYPSPRKRRLPRIARKQHAALVLVFGSLDILPYFQQPLRQPPQPCTSMRDNTPSAKR